MFRYAVVSLFAWRFYGVMRFVRKGTSCHGEIHSLVR